MNRSKTFVFLISVCVILLAGGSTPALSAVKFELVDELPAQDREGQNFPDFVLHGSQSIGVDLLSILKTKMLRRFGPRLQGKRIWFTDFSIMETTGRFASLGYSSAKYVPNVAPDWPILIAKIGVQIDGHFSNPAGYKTILMFGSGSVPLLLPFKDSKATKADLTKVTVMAIDKLLEDMEKSWCSSYYLDGEENCNQPGKVDERSDLFFYK